MTIAVVVDLNAPTPAYEQIRAQIAGRIAGQLTSGDRLPVVRAMATDLGLTTNTIARAYQELKATGLVTSRRRVGTMVTAPVAAVPSDVLAGARALVMLSRQAGVANEVLVDVVRGAWQG